MEIYSENYRESSGIAINAKSFPKCIQKQCLRGLQVEQVRALHILAVLVKHITHNRI